MADRFQPSEEMIQDYIDGRLNERDHASVAAFLMANPQKAAEVEGLRELNDALRGLGTEVLDEPIPDHLRAIIDAAKSEGDVRQRRRAHTALIREVMVGALMFVIGVGVGWFGHSWVNPDPTVDQVALYSAEGAYLLYSVERNYPVEFAADRTDALSGWFKKAFQKDIGPPELSEIGYEFVGGRLLPWTQGNFGFYLFENNENKRVAVVFWPRKTPPSPVSAILEGGSVRTQYWGQPGFGFAVMSDTANQQLADVSESVFKFYQKAFETPNAATQ